ncbi:hypothetical protein ACIBQ0_16900 [Nocardia nova]|uniref:hypothetical protein n=1 Tax=Nocardia nova TaxID=37330 RepID=UPI0037B377DD
MSTQSDERVDSIESLDFEPECTSRTHSAERPPAVYHIDQHGCCVHLFCADCLRNERKVIQEALAQGKTVECMHCLRTFPSFEDCYTRVVPL